MNVDNADRILWRGTARSLWREDRLHALRPLGDSNRLWELRESEPMGHEGGDVHFLASDQLEGLPGLHLRRRVARDHGDLAGHEHARVDVETGSRLRDPEEDDGPSRPHG